MPPTSAADSRSSIRRALAAGVLAVALSGCEKAMQDMYNQPKYKPFAASALWRDGQSARPDVPGTVAASAGATAGTSSGRLGGLPVPADDAPTYPVDERGDIRANLIPGSPP